ncbi:hypothetical protein HAZT_HAZT004553 [Hyalella azteca]|uniref:Uncharacterized protein n=1 Tax=Hyalella azteca TaxID=294128 RepID=A0A6A0HDE0_HYAAZ|nr:hypothetical protein HAZT_HAZT004553 [Hyalella azteca]
MGVDSTSRQNIRRFLPETFKFLSDDPSSMDFMGYNKVADNTDVNISPVIMGNRAEDLMRFKLECYKKQKRGGRFEGSVVSGDKSWKVLEEISRINLYNNKSACVDETELKKFCHCR